MWTVRLHRKAETALKDLPPAIRESFILLARDIQRDGPIRGDWPYYSKLSGGRHHCHRKRGKPTYVAVWHVVKYEIKIIEVTYVGTHERAPS